MTLILDAGGISVLAVQPARVAELRRRGHWPAQVPAVVLVEVLTGHHHRDLAVNRLLRACQIRPVDEIQSRDAARLRYATGRAGTISAVDAVVAAFAVSRADPIVLTSDPDDMRALAEQADHPIRIVAV